MVLDEILGYYRMHETYPLIKRIITSFNELEDSKRLLKTLWEKEKMLVTSIFSYFHSVF